jgi:RecB family endonuclease NucS
MMKDRIKYAEAVAHFGLMTYLDRVANGGGRVDREYAVGRGKLDLLLVHGDVRLPIEVKVHRSEGGGDPTPKGLEQLDRYCEGLQLDTGWLVVFDQRKTKRRVRRLEHEEVVTPGGRKVFVVRA